MVVDRGEPQAVGVDVGQRAQRHEQDDQDDDDADQPPAGAAARRGGRSACQVAGGAHGGEPNVRYLPPTGRRPRRDAPERPGQAGVGATRHRQPEWAGGCGCPVGNPSDAHRARQRVVVAVRAATVDVSDPAHLPPLGAAADAGREGLRRRNRRPGARPARPATPGTPRRHARRVVAVVAVLDPPAQHRHHGARQARPRSVDRAASAGHRRRGSPGEHRPGGEGVGQVAARGGGERCQLDVLGAEQGLDRGSTARCAGRRAAGSGRRPAPA